MKNLQKIIFDRYYLLLISLPIPVWFYLSSFSEINYLPFDKILTLIILFPIIEETLFRGILLPFVSNKFPQRWKSITVANVATSILFSISHLYAHDPIWAFATFLPSLVFGWAQERYNNLLAPISLHSYYNAGWFLLIN